jgi:hypothetical protein
MHDASRMNTRIVCSAAFGLGLVLAVAPATRAADPPPDLQERYSDTGSQTERPGKHSTTTGRHGTSGEAGGGIDAQSGARTEPSQQRPANDNIDEHDRPAPDLERH